MMCISFNWGAARFFFWSIQHIQFEMNMFSVFVFLQAKIVFGIRQTGMRAMERAGQRNRGSELLVMGRWYLMLMLMHISLARRFIFYATWQSSINYSMAHRLPIGLFPHILRCSGKTAWKSVPPFSPTPHKHILHRPSRMWAVCGVVNG